MLLRRRGKPIAELLKVISTLPFRWGSNGGSRAENCSFADVPEPRKRPRKPKDKLATHPFSVALGGHAFTVDALLWLAAVESPVGVIQLADGVGLYDGGGVKLAKHLHKHGLVSMVQRRGYGNKPSYEITLSELGRGLVPPVRAALELFLAPPPHRKESRKERAG